jgi:hypothetical protein
VRLLDRTIIIIAATELGTSPFYVFKTHDSADDAIKRLSRDGFDVRKLSLVGKGSRSEERPMGFYAIDDKVKTWGGVGAFWGGVWGLLMMPAVFLFPGVGLLASAGPIGTAIVGALEGAVVGGGLSALGAALTRIGFSHDQAMRYETALRADMYVLTVHGSAEDREQVRLALAGSDAWSSALGNSLRAAKFPAELSTMPPFGEEA